MTELSSVGELRDCLDGKIEGSLHLKKISAGTRRLGERRRVIYRRDSLGTLDRVDRRLGFRHER